MKKIAILGASSHIAKGLIVNFSKSSDYELYLFARSTQKVNAFLAERRLKNIKHVYDIHTFPLKKYDAVINCIGVGQPEKLQEIGYSIFQITEEFDNLVIDFLKKNQKCLYLGFSSGAVYGNKFKSAVNLESPAIFDVNNLTINDAYGLAKLISEAKHRSLVDYNIIDIRIFSYFSHDINPNSKFLLSEVVRSINDEKILETSENNIIRDYIDPLDLFQLVTLCIKNQGINDVFDAYSKKPISKFELFDFLAKKYDFRYKVKTNINIDNSTGSKNFYYSTNYKAKKIGYSPRYTSLEAISGECSVMIRRNHE